MRKAAKRFKRRRSGKKLTENDFKHLLDKAAEFQYRKFLNTMKSISEAFPPEKGPHEVRDVFKHFNVPFPG